MRTVANGKISMILNLLQNQNNIQPFTNQPISLFIDNNIVRKACIFDSNISGNVLKKGNLYYCKIINTSYSLTITKNSFFTFSGDVFKNGIKSSSITKTVDFVVGEKINIFVSSITIQGGEGGNRFIKRNLNINTTIKSISQQTTGQPSTSIELNDTGDFSQMTIYGDNFNKYFTNRSVNIYFKYKFNNSYINFTTNFEKWFPHYQFSVY